MKLLFASQNRHKVEEIRHILGKEFEVLGLRDVGYYEEIPEPYNTLEDNALAKARHLYRATGFSCFADDTGLEIIALQMAPGVFSARYAMERGPFMNQEGSYRANLEKVLEQLMGVENRKAVFRTVIALIIQGNEMLFEGVVHGHITTSARGTKGFGYDPIFIPDGYALSYAEMSLNEKNRMSHRAMAIKKLQLYLKEYMGKQQDRQEY